ncbi:uncharacterized protein EI90DRAFT_3017402 [Cantharellus anzutake]|uniref:uncharacterized protein n=1 Tax=Cantharellus anzutake TaxID=1750568 RepID=UPI00190349B3|nr:uncharacterized protein EI90DRAFT_3017402 [Cantharellus anzutake]KAF8329167.1 hypothetical protein EI90DRAFT_3017402 [Cantharellus anzutake]
MATALITFILANNVYAAPILPYPLNATSLSINVSEACNDLRNCRTLWNLVYSCLLTIFICVWTAVHPNVEHHRRMNLSMGDRIEEVMERRDRFGLMRSSLIFPEWVVAMAWEEFSAAWKISRKCKNVEGWTLVHSYFVEMGGFIDPTTRFFRRRDPSFFGQYPGIIRKTGNRHVVAVTKQDILHKSKGDFLSKSIVSLQLLWFIVQYVGRWVGHLHKSQLEAMTLGYSALSIIICALWWHKPLDIRSPIQVTPRGDSTHLPTSEANVTQVPLEVENESHSPSLAARAIGRACDAFVELDASWIFVLTGAIFGRIHCSAWSFPFPTHAESLMWRICAVSITVAPALGIGGSRMLYKTFHGSHSDFSRAIGTVYVVARIILFALTFASLRSPSPSLYRTPPWSSFLPHLG